MYYKRAKEGIRVRVTKDIDQAVKGTEGIIVELRGYNYEGSKIVGRFVQVWSEVTPSGHKSRRNLAVTTEVLEEIK